MAKNIWLKLIEEGIISEEMLNIARENQKKNNAGLGFNLALLGADEEEIAKKMAEHYGVDYIDLLNIDLDSEVLKLLDQDTALSLKIFPVKKVNNTVIFACADPIHPDLSSFLQNFSFRTGFNAEIGIAPESYIKLAIEQNLPKIEKSSMRETLEELGDVGDTDLEVLKDTQETEEAETLADETPVIRLCNSIISDAVEKRASDIHIEPFEKKILLRYRIDGSLVEQPSPPLKYKKALVSRFKVMAKLDIIEKRKPQDGRIKIKVKGKTIDLRVSTLPVVWGEKIVMRILDQSNLNLDLTKLGFEPDDLKKFEKAIRSPYGIILVTGPTGSGKTTTLYSALSTINTPEKNIMTAEDPVEYQLPNINQVQINPEVDLTFANALRAFLRQDPDVIMVGEIRDTETAEIAIKAALTGHLVISTLHTNDAPTTISRLADMGIEPFYIGSAVILVVAQRLVKKICPECKTETKYDFSLLKQIGFTDDEIKNAKLYKGEGCSYCNDTGYKGRIAIYEVMEINEDLRKIILKGEDASVIRDIARKNGMKTLREAAILKLKSGVTTLEEVMRATMGD